MDYEVIDPSTNYAGKSYSEWASDWFNWFLSADADKRFFGPVVFLRSKGMPSRTTGANISDIPSPGVDVETSSDPNYTKIYVNDPNIKIGGERMQIFINQSVFVPIITAYEVVPPGLDWGSLHEFTGLTIDYGDNPPAHRQLTINGQYINLGGREMKDFRINTPIFTAVVPDSVYGSSVKDFLETPVSPGNYPAIIDGYFVMLKFTKGTYFVHSWASGPRETAGPYFSELLYQIEVEEPKDPIGVRTVYHPARNERLVRKVLKDKKDTGELDSVKYDQLMDYFGKLWSRSS